MPKAYCLEQTKRLTDNRLISRNNCGICGTASRSDKHVAKLPAMVLQSLASQKFPKISLDFLIRFVSRQNE